MYFLFHRLSFILALNLATDLNICYIQHPKASDEPISKLCLEGHPLREEVCSDVLGHTDPKVTAPKAPEISLANSTVQIRKHILNNPRDSLII